jgi:hypothetical protein
MLPVPTLFLWCSAAVVLAMIGLFLSIKCFKPVDVDKHESFINATLTIVGTLVAILLGLLVSNSVEYYDSVETNATAEATTLSQIFRLSTGLPDQPKFAIQKLCEKYNGSILNEEWPAMENNEMAVNSELTYSALSSAIISFRSSNNSESNIQNALLTAVLNLGDYRRRRHMALESTWSDRILPVLLGCAAIVLVYAFLYTKREDRFLHTLLVCFVACTLGANVGMTFLLRRPFSNSWKIAPSGFQLNARLFDLYKSKGQVK